MCISRDHFPQKTTYVRIFISESALGTIQTKIFPLKWILFLPKPESQHFLVPFFYPHAAFLPSLTLTPFILCWYASSLLIYWHSSYYPRSMENPGLPLYPNSVISLRALYRRTNFASWFPMFRLSLALLHFSHCLKPHGGSHHHPELLYLWNFKLQFTFLDYNILLYQLSYPFNTCSLSVPVLKASTQSQSNLLFIFFAYCRATTPPPPSQVMFFFLKKKFLWIPF